MKELFKEFASTSEADWLKKIEVDLKGKSLDVLKSKPEPDLEIIAYHHADSAVYLPENAAIRNLSRNANQWGIRQEFNDNKENNNDILEALNDGVTSIGLSINDPVSFKSFTKDVQFQYISSDIKYSSLEVALKTQVPSQSTLNFDSIALNAEKGSSDIEMASFLEFYKSKPTHKSIWVSGNLYGEAGASTIQELAFTVGHLNEYIQLLFDQNYSLAEINDKITVSLSVNENYFVNIAKFRAIHALISLLFEGYDPKYKAKNATIYGKTNLRHHAKNDKNNNPLRETTQAMSAIIGGCDTLTVAYPSFGTENEINRFRRIAKNIQLILKEESYFDKVVDPSGGAYYIESITNQLIEKAWAIFLEVEHKGGIVKSIESNDIQTRIGENKNQLIADLNLNQRTFLGVNKHANAMEDWVNLNPPKMEEPTAFVALAPFYLEDHFTKTNLR